LSDRVSHKNFVKKGEIGELSADAICHYPNKAALFQKFLKVARYRYMGATFRKHLTSATCAIALVCSLNLYKRDVARNPLDVAQNHWEAIATEDTERLSTGYREDAILNQSHGLVAETYQGQSISAAWEQFFSQYTIEDFKVVAKERRDRLVAAEFKITAKSDRGSTVFLWVSYQVHVDATGKITQEVWQANSEFVVQAIPTQHTAVDRG
jgi:hypothetical protein